MRKTILLLLALVATPSLGQQALCDYTAEADAADIDGLELLMGDPLNSCEGYSVSFANFLKTIQLGIIDADSDGTREITVIPTATGFDNAVEFRSRDDSTVRAAILSDGSIRIKTYLVWMDDANVSIYNTSAGEIGIGATRLNLALEDSVIQIGVSATGAIPACDSVTARGLIWDVTGDLCACPPDGSDWAVVVGAGACA